MSGSLFVLGKQGFDLCTVGRIRDEVRHLLAHVLLGKLEEAINLLPELLFGRHGSRLLNLNISKVHGFEDAHACLEALITFKMSQLASLSKSENAESRVGCHANEVIKHGCVGLADAALLDGLSEPDLKGVLTVVLPYALEVGLL